MKHITEKDFKTLDKELQRALDGLREYILELEDPWVCEKHLSKMREIFNKYQDKNKEE